MSLKRTKLQQQKFGFYKFMCFVLLLIISSNGFVRKVSANYTRNKNDYADLLSSQLNDVSASAEFSTFTLIYPQISHGYHRTASQKTLRTEGEPHPLDRTPDIVLTYNHRGRPIHVDLKLNDELLPEEHFLKFQDSKSNLNYAVKRFAKTESEPCHYQGSIRGKPDSRVAISTCDGDINGIVVDSTDAYIIHSQNNETLKSQHFLFRTSDLRHKSAPRDHSSAEDILANFRMRHKRSSDDLSFSHGPYKANKQSLYVELVLVADNSVYRFFEDHMGKVHQYCKDLANIMNALYAPLNIFVILTGVVIWNERDEIKYDDESRETLHNFLEYRSTTLSPEHPNDHAQLLTKRKFNDNIVGKAFVGPMCTNEKSGAVCSIHSEVIAVVANTMSHEMGHSFGMAHDSPNCKCPDKKCIMSDTSSSFIPTRWSSCSIKSLRNALSRGLSYCLRNKPIKNIASSMCGNGFVEPGEECDCGLPGFCQSNCCNPKTCRLYSNATCGSGECCDMNSCRIKTAGTACRSAVSECDLPEFCTGESEYCPRDVHKSDATECDNGGGYCYGGDCGSHNKQCRELWGAAAVNVEHCYSTVNKRGDNAGNCGLNVLNKEPIKCEEEHVKCGKLQCNYPQNWNKFGIVSNAQTSTTYALYNRKYVECHSALFNIGLHSPDPGMSPNGAKCGDKNMCLEQRCVSVDKIIAQRPDLACPENCNGNGICNSEGNCHCDIGFAGSTCRAIGPGGSIDSGPATNPNNHDAFKRFLYVFFGGVIPTVILYYVFIFFYRSRRLCKHKKIMKNDVLPFSEIMCEPLVKSSLLRSPTNDIQIKEQNQHKKKVTKSEESVNRRMETEQPEFSSNSVSVDETNLPKVHESIESLSKNFRNSFIAKSASNYELSTLSDSTKTLPCPDRKAGTPVFVKKSFKSASTLTGAIQYPNNSLKPKIEISDVRLQSSTNPLAVALGDGVALMGNCISDSNLDSLEGNKSLQNNMPTL